MDVLKSYGAKSTAKSMKQKRVRDTRNSREKITMFGIVSVVPSLASFSTSFVTLNLKQSVSRDCSALLGRFY